MYHIFVTFVLLAGGPPVQFGVSNQGFDTKEACVAAIPALNDRANKELAAQGAKIGSAECLTDDEIKAKVEELNK